MKRSILSLSAAALLVAGGFALGHAASSPAPTTAPAQAQTKWFKIATIRGAQDVRDFQHNVQVMQSERQAAADLQAQVEKEKNAAKKKELQAQLDAALKKLNEDNAVMAKTYGFSLSRNYTLEVQEMNIYVQVSDEEAAKIEKQAQQAQQAQKKK